MLWVTKVHHIISAPEDFVLERHYSWKNGQAGEILRQYLKGLGIESNVVFHSLRACFATHMLASGVNQATVMKSVAGETSRPFRFMSGLQGLKSKAQRMFLMLCPRWIALQVAEF